MTRDSRKAVMVGRSHWRPAQMLGVLISVLLLATGCGNRLSHERLEAAARGRDTVSSVQAPTAPTGAMGQVEAAVPSSGVIARPASAVDAPSPLPVPNYSTTQPVRTADPRVPGPPVVAGGRGAKRANPDPAPACIKPLAPIRIGSVGHNSGVIGAVFGGGGTVLQAWARWMNDRGGINCHPVQVFVGDDGEDPAVLQTVVKRFVEENGVAAFVFMNAPLTADASVAYLKSKGIPVFGSEGGSEAFNRNPNYFPQMSSGRSYVESTFAMAGATLVPQGKTKLASITCLEIQICSDAYDYVGAVSAKYGMTLVYRGQVSITQPNYTAACLQAKNAGAQIIFTGMDGNSDQRLARSCTAVGLKAVIITPAVGLNPQQAAAPDLAGIELATVVAPWFDTGNKAIAQYRSVLAEYAPPGLEPGANGVAAWTAAQVFAFAAEKAGADLTSASILQGAFQVKNNDFGGITGPLTYRASDSSHPQGMCWWGIEVDGQKSVTLNGGKRTCQ